MVHRNGRGRRWDAVGRTPRKDKGRMRDRQYKAIIVLILAVGAILVVIVAAAAWWVAGNVRVVQVLHER